MDSGKSDWHPADIIASLKKRGDNPGRLVAQCGTQLLNAC
ncbi:hypothetical protein Mm0Y_00323 [Morganella morganii]|nr:hypothetical protein Mm0Y_00323 [Morganella morganii]